MSTMIFYKSWWEAITQIPAEGHLRLCVLAAILNYGFYGETPEEHWGEGKAPSEVEAMFRMAQPFIDRNVERFQQSKSKK